MEIKRTWHGWTTEANAGAYEEILSHQVLPSIEAKSIPGYLGIEVLRRDQEGEVEFMTIMTFESLSSVMAFQGEDYERCYVPEAAQKVLKRWDQRADHFEVREQRSYR